MMASKMRHLRALYRTAPARDCARQTVSPGPFRGISTRHLPPQAPVRRASPPSSRQASWPSTLPQRCAHFHASGPRLRRAHNNEVIPEGPPTTDFNRMDMLGQTPAPSTSVDICSSDGFKLNSGVSIYDGKGVMLVGGEAFEWQPWGRDMKLVNNKGQWEVEDGAFGLLDLLWPRPGTLCCL